MCRSFAKSWSSTAEANLSARLLKSGLGLRVFRFRGFRVLGFWGLRNPEGSGSWRCLGLQSSLGRVLGLQGLGFRTLGFGACAVKGQLHSSSGSHDLTEASSTLLRIFFSTGHCAHIWCRASLHLRLATRSEPTR